MANDPKILVFDIESTNLRADVGFCLCVGYKWFGKSKVEVPTLQEYPDGSGLDAALMRHIYPVMAAADIWVTYNGIRFDVPFLNTRMFKAGLPPLPPIPHVDALYIMKSKFKLHSNRLASVQEFLELPDEKTPLRMEVWMKAMMGDSKALKYIVQHCKQDVKVLDEAYEILRPYLTRHPRVNGYGPCAVCGENRLQSRGYSVVKAPLKNKKRRVQCQACGAWETRALTKAELLEI